ncbi:MAG TPA: DUF6034 family protein [Negativicutes bacterium]|nr:DUF6034 family protein [Negativicutes bacterium]
MKRIESMIIAIFTLCILSACQPTPETDIVTPKDDTRLIEMAQSGEAEMSISDMIGAPENYAFEASSEDGNVHITANADVVLPEVDDLPIVRVSRHTLTEQDMKNVFSTLCNGNTVVDEDGALWKSYYQVTLERLISMRQEGRLDKYDSVEELDAAISELMGKIQEAPDKPEAINPDFTFHAVDNYTFSARILSTADNVALSELHAINQEDSVTIQYVRDIQKVALYHSQIMATTPYYIAGLYSDSNQTVLPPTISKEDAQQIANETINTIGYSDLSCSGSRLAPIGDAHEGNVFDGVYEFVFTRTVNGVNTTFTNDVYAAPPDDPNSMTRPWGYEHIRVFIDDAGVACLLINDPYQIEETVSEQTTVLPFSDIAKVFEHMIQTKYLSVDSDKKTEVHIEKVELGLCRIFEKDNSSYGLLVPAWDFIGTLTESNSNKSFTYGRDGYHCLLTINAIDGSIIDRGMGY